MKHLFQISLVLNVLLAVAIGWRSTHEPQLLRPLRMVVSKGDPKSSRLITDSRSGTASSPTEQWKAIESSDLQQFMAQLRAVGCPEQTIRDIVTLRVCRQYRNRLMDAQAEAMRSQGYTRQISQKTWKEQSRMQLDLRDEMITTLESLFGEPWQKLAAAVQNSPTMWQSDSLGSFSIESRQKIREVEAQFREMNSLAQERYMGGLYAEDRAKLREGERQRRAALAAVLSPEELEEYLYRKSPAAEYVRQNLPEAKSADEYRKMVKLALEMDMSEALDSYLSQRRMPDEWDAPDARQEIEQRQKAFDERLKEVLGETRVAEQRAEEQARVNEAQQREQGQSEQRVRDQMAAVATEVGIPSVAASRFFDRVKELKPTLDAKFAELEKSFAGSPEEKQKQMQAAVKAELDRIAIETMGPKGPELIEKMMKTH